MMNYHQIGSTGLSIPRVTFGTAGLGNQYQVFPKELKLAIVREIFNHVQAPVALDSAGKYGAGLSLEAIGWSLAELGIPQEDVVISNKLGWRRVPLSTPEPTFEPGVWFGLEHDAVQDISYKGILRCWEQGCELLGGSYIPQMISVHDPDEYLAKASSEAEKQRLFEDILEAYQALAQLKKTGQAKAIGVGAKDWTSIQAISKEVDLDWVMLANSMTLYSHPAELLAFMDELKAKNVAIINSAVFNAGFLTGGEFFNYRKLNPDNEKDKPLFEWREKFFALCEQHKVNPATACVQFGISHPGIVSVALSTSKPERVKDNIESVTVAIPGDFWQALKQAKLISPDYPYLS
jgi:D-threo-aldose 1-dehydrogenase